MIQFHDYVYTCGHEMHNIACIANLFLPCVQMQQLGYAFAVCIIHMWPKKLAV